MHTCTLNCALKDHALRARLVHDIISGKLFIYPTDTIYGIGCNAEKESSVLRIREAKSRGSAPFSVIAPSKEWIWSHTNISPANRELADKLLPGPYTLILPANNKSPKPVVSSQKTIGLRMPRHPFMEIISEAGVPFVTTSVNRSGQLPVKSLRDVPEDIRKYIDWAVDGGVLDGHPSRIFDMTGPELKIMSR